MQWHRNGPSERTRGSRCLGLLYELFVGERGKIIGEERVEHSRGWFGGGGSMDGLERNVGTASSEISNAVESETCATIEYLGV